MNPKKNGNVDEDEENTSQVDILTVMPKLLCTTFFFIDYEEEK